MVTIEYRPLSIYRVNPVTRCTDSIPGHTEAILHVSFSPDGLVLGTGGGDVTYYVVDFCSKTNNLNGLLGLSSSLNAYNLFCRYLN